MDDDISSLRANIKIKIQCIIHGYNNITYCDTSSTSSPSEVLGLIASIPIKHSVASWNMLHKWEKSLKFHRNRR